MLQTKFKHGKKKKKRTITQKSNKQEWRFMCTALLRDEIYPPMKFHNHSQYSFEDKLWTKFKYDNKQRAITQKLSKPELQFMCTALPLTEIYPPTKFHNHNLYKFEDMHCTNSSMKINKGQ